MKPGDFSSDGRSDSLGFQKQDLVTSSAIEVPETVNWRHVPVRRKNTEGIDLVPKIREVDRLVRRFERGRKDDS